MRCRLFVVLPACSLAMLAFSGCPWTQPAVDWPSERIDTNPSTTPVAVEILDIDGDGLKDVVSLWRGGGSRVGTVVIHFQDAGGWTQALIQSSTKYAQANGLTVADINLDGHPDIVVAAQDRIIYLKAPAAPRTTADWQAFEIASSIKTEFKAWFDVAAAQIDGQNGLDIVATLNDDGRLVFFRSPSPVDKADGWDLVSIDSTTRQGADSLLLADLSGDGRLDVLSTATGDSSGVLSWYEQPADPVTQAWTKHVMSSWGGATRFGLGDLDGDARPDIAIISGKKGQVAWLPHPGTASKVWNGWVLADYTKLKDDQREPVDVAIADMDANGSLDVVVATANPAGLFWYSPDTDNRYNWVEHRIAAIASSTFAFFAVDDLNSDNLPEVLVPINYSGDDTLDRVDRYINPAAGG